MAVLRLGVDIGATRLRVVLAAHGPDGGIENVAVRELPARVSSSGVIHDPEAVGAILREALDEIGSRETRCVLTIGWDAARYYVGPFPKKGNIRRRRAAAEFVGRQAFPDLYEENKDEIATIVLPHPSDEKQGVILAVRRDALNSRVAVAAAAGLRVSAIDHEAFALQRAFPTATVVLDVGYEESRLYGFSDPVRPIVETSRIAGEAITEALAFELQVDLTVAERRKRDEGSAARARRAFEDLGAFVAEKQAELRSGGVHVERIVLVGNGARVSELPEVVERETEFPAELATLAGVSTSYQPGALARMAPDIAAAYGAALFEHGPTAFDYAQANRTGLWHEIIDGLGDTQVRLSAGALAAAVAILFVTGIVQHERLDRARSDEQVAAARELASYKKFTELSAFVANVAKAVAVKDQIQSQRRSAAILASYLTAIEDKMPPHLALQSVAATGTGWTITGRTRNERFVATAIDGVDEIPGLAAQIGPVLPVDAPAAAVKTVVTDGVAVSIPVPKSSPRVSFQIDVTRLAP